MINFQHQRGNGDVLILDLGGCIPSEVQQQVEPAKEQRERCSFGLQLVFASAHGPQVNQGSEVDHPLDVVDAISNVFQPLGEKKLFFLRR